MFKKLWLTSLIILSFGLPTVASSNSFYHSDHRAPYVKMELIKESSLLTRGSNLSGEALAWTYLKSNAARYGLNGVLENLKLEKVQQSLVGDHFHFAQYLQGYPVHRGEIVVTISHDSGDVAMVYNNTYPVARSLRAPAVRLGHEDALDVAWSDLRVHGEMMAPNKARLAYVPEDGNLRLVYLVDIAVEGPFGYWEHQIDAANGEVVDSRNAAISRVALDELDFDHYDGPVMDRRAAESSYAAKLSRSQTRSKAGVAADASGTVFDPDPVTALQNSSLQDTSSAASFSGAYVTRTLKDVDLSGGTYSLTGPWVTIANFESPNTSPSTTTNGSWTATRGNNSFNDAMTYFHLDQNQRYIQSLGFSGSTGIQYNSIQVDSDGLGGDDNSHYIPSSNRVAFGHGCVDDNEDAFVILHEYGHAMHFSINSNWSGGDTGGMGEGFGDYWGGSYRYRTPNGNFNSAWAFPWDGHNNCWGGRDMDKTSFQYDPSRSYPAHASVGGVYSDELWSTPLFQALITLTGQGVAHSEVDQVILQSHFGLGSGVTMRQMATAIVNAANSLYPSGPHAAVFTEKFEAQNILDGGTTPPDPTGTELTNNQTVSNLGDATGNEKLYFIAVPAGATNLSFAISGGSGDADLYTRQGAAPTTSTYDCRPYQSGNNENCDVASPSAATYYAMIRAYSTYSGLSLTVSYDAPGGSNQAPNAGFSVSTSNLTANFTDSSSDSDGSIASRSWDFGDGGSSSATNPSHSYASAGTYTVTLTVTDNDGATDSASQSVTVTSAPGGSWTTISSDNFESGWGTFNDGGSDVRRSANDSAYAHQGTYCVRLRDNSGSASAMTSDAVNLSGYNEVRVNFWFYAVSMENNEDFFVEYYDGSSWNIVATYARGSEFNNDQFYNPEVTIDGGSYNLGSGAQFRIRCDASANGDRVYIDEVVISAR